MAEAQQTAAVATKASEPPQDKGATSGARKPEKKNPKPKRNPNIPAPSPGTYAAKIKTSMEPNHLDQNFEYDESGFMKITQLVHNSIVANFKDLKEDNGDTMAFFGRLALAKQFAKTAVDFQGDMNPDTVTVANLAQEVPAPIFIGASQLGYISHEGIDHYPEDSASQAMRQLLLAAAKKKVLSQEEEACLPYIVVDFEKRRFSVEDFHSKLSAQAKRLPDALKLAVASMEPVEQAQLDENNQVIGTAKIKLNDDMFRGYNQSANITEFIAGNGAIFKRYGLNSDTFALKAAQFMTSDESDNEVYQAATAIFATLGETKKTYLSFTKVYSRVSEIRTQEGLKLIGKIKAKIKMLDISGLNGKGTLAQFVRKNDFDDPDEIPRSPYSTSSEETTYGLFFMPGGHAQENTWIDNRYIWPNRQDLDNERLLWIRSFLMKEK